jgi:putative Mg2+ transporter-C (MgtC) family protein
MGAVAEWELVVRFALAALLGGAVGLERESRNHIAGIGTCSLAALGACVFTTSGAYGFGDAAAASDPSRVAAQVVTGIGFIGAGAILRHGTSVRGVTTAAALWLTAALGVAVGAGAYIAAIGAFVVAFVALFGARLLKPVVLRSAPRMLEVEYDRGHGTLGPLLNEIQESLHGRVNNIHIQDDDGGIGTRRVLLELLTRDDQTLERIMTRLSSRPEVRSIRWFARR